MQNIEEIDSKAREILKLNDKGAYTIPTAGLYPHQWNWDSAFAAIGFAQFDIGRAWQELETLFSAQWSNGMVPHIVFHVEDNNRYFPGSDIWSCGEAIPTSGITQPPIAITAARLLFEIDPEHSRDRASALFGKMVSWHNWFIDWRLDRGAVCASHPWESGRDNALDWDNAFAQIDPTDVGEYSRSDTTYVEDEMRPTKYEYDRFFWLVEKGRALGWDEKAMLANAYFRVADPTLTFTLLRANRDLVALGNMLGIDTSAVASKTAMLEDGAKTLWNPLGFYDSRDALTGAWSNSLSNASFLCWYAGLESPKMLDKLKKVMDKVAYGVPSLTPDDKKFDAKRYWRGPVWAIVNMLIAIGMESMGIGEAERIRKSTQKLISKHGFSEYFDPCDGSPAGGKAFTWTAAVWLSWASPNAKIK